MLFLSFCFVVFFSPPLSPSQPFLFSLLSPHASCHHLGTFALLLSLSTSLPASRASLLATTSACRALPRVGLKFVFFSPLSPLSHSTPPIAACFLRIYPPPMEATTAPAPFCRPLAADSPLGLLHLQAPCLQVPSSNPPRFDERTVSLPIDAQVRRDMLFELRALGSTFELCTSSKRGTLRNACPRFEE